MKKYQATTLAAILFFALSAGAEVFELKSPDGKLEAKIESGNGYMLSAKKDGEVLVENAKFALTTPRGKLCTRNPYCLDKRFVREGSESEHYNQLEFSCLDQGYRIFVRAYNDAVAYRIEIKEHPVIETVISEQLDVPCKIRNGSWQAPIIFEMGKNKNKVVLLESATNGYPALKMVSKDGVLKTNFKSFKDSDDEFEPPYIFRLDGKACMLPWRAFAFVYGYADDAIDAIKAKLDKKN